MPSEHQDRHFYNMNLPEDFVNREPERVMSRGKIIDYEYNLLWHENLQVIIKKKVVKVPPLKTNG